ncbi:MAG TPA: 50S ribosomal protein L10 [Patescibacteria group bacterium]|nr:50S ribosomal protein L10 [Patescibacteria group bacterium]
MSQVSQEKLEIVDSTVQLLEGHEIIGAADLHKVGSGMLQDMRKQLRGQVQIKGIKNTLMRIAMEKVGLAGTEEFLNEIKGQNVYIFSNGNPFKLAMTLHGNKVKVFAKAGDAALNNIVISAGNTGLSPGPIISKFGAQGIRTRIEAGNIWVVQDTEVAKTGDVFTGDLADLLTRLDIRAAEMGLEIKAVYEKGVIIHGKELILDIEEYASRLASAYSNAFQVALKSAYPTKDTIASLLSIAAQNVRKVAVKSNYLTSETAPEIIAKVNAQALSLAKAVGRAQAKQ